MARGDLKPESPLCPKCEGKVDAAVVYLQGAAMILQPCNHELYASDSRDAMQRIGDQLWQIARWHADRLEGR